MNRRMILSLLGNVLLIIGGALLLPLLVGLLRGEQAVWSILYTMAVCAGLGVPLRLLRPRTDRAMHAKDGFVMVALSWIVISLVGALPFWFSGEIPSYLDALFEAVSGFTTTGSSILGTPGHMVEDMSGCLLFWRSFTHWLGGMGVLVFVLALGMGSDGKSGFTMHLLRAESPGPSVGKLVPKMRSTATILYAIYMALTILNILFLLLGGIPVFDAVCTAFGTAGTGGFGIKNDSIAGYSPYVQNVCTVFMMLFGVNFSCYYLLLIRQVKNVFRDEELRFYLGTALVSTLLITWNVSGMYDSFSETLRHAAFQVASIMTTTGFATTDFDLWPSFSKAILLVLMLIGPSAGSTGGGIKCGRLLLIIKSIRRNVGKVMNPQKVQVVKVNGEMVSEKVLDNIGGYLAAYVMITVVSFLLVSLDGFSVTTNISAVVACFNNIGPGFEAVGPTANFSGFGPLSKLVLIMDMLAGRLEIFPILILFSKNAWRSR